MVRYLGVWLGSQGCFLSHSKDGRPWGQMSQETSGTASASCGPGELSVPEVRRALLAESHSGPLEGVLTCVPEVWRYLRVCFGAQTCGENGRQSDCRALTPESSPHICASGYWLPWEHPPPPDIPVGWVLGASRQLQE